MYVLNKPKQEWLEPKDPDLVARELMRDLISIIQGSVSKHFFLVAVSNLLLKLYDIH